MDTTSSPRNEESITITKLKITRPAQPATNFSFSNKTSSSSSTTEDEQRRDLLESDGYPDNEEPSLISELSYAKANEPGTLKGKQKSLEDSGTNSFDPTSYQFQRLFHTLSIMPPQEFTKIIGELSVATKSQLLGISKQILPPFEQHIVDQNHILVQLLSMTCPPGEEEKLSHALVTVHEYHQISSALMRTFVEMEIQTHDEIELVFRGGTVACRGVSFYMNQIGFGYLNHVILPVVTKILSEPEKDYEIDPTFLSTGQNLSKNQVHLNSLTTFFLDTLLNSRGSCPYALKLLVHNIRLKATNKFRGTEFMKALSSAFILQFINPALASPVNYKLASNNPSIQSTKMQRTLVLLTKILQTLANNQVGSCNSIFAPMIPLLREYEDVVQHFLQLLSDAPPHSSPTHYSVSLAQYTIAITYLKTLTEKNVSFILQTLKTCVIFNGKSAANIQSYLESLLAPSNELKDSKEKELKNQISKESSKESPKDKEKNFKELKEQVKDLPLGRFEVQKTPRRKSVGPTSKKYTVSSPDLFERKKVKSTAITTDQIHADSDNQSDSWVIHPLRSPRVGSGSGTIGAYSRSDYIFPTQSPRRIRGEIAKSEAKQQ